MQGWREIIVSLGWRTALLLLLYQVAENWHFKRIRRTRRFNQQHQ
jgi:hypothetical protein